jgi:NAD-dependent DNA ligase
MLRGIKGIGVENAQSFVENIPRFMAFLQECDLEEKLSLPTVVTETVEHDTSHPLYGKHVVMTKIRDKAVIEELKKAGGILDNSMSKTTFVLVVESNDVASNKTEYATKNNIPIMTLEEFREAYLQH